MLQNADNIQVYSGVSKIDGVSLFPNPYHYAPGLDMEAVMGGLEGRKIRVPGVYSQFPNHGTRKFRQSNVQRFPIGVRGDIDDLGPGIGLLACKHNANIAVIVCKLILPGGNAVEAHIREPAGAVADVGTQNTVILPKADHDLEKPEDILILF